MRERLLASYKRRTGTNRFYTLTLHRNIPYRPSPPFPLLALLSPATLPSKPSQLESQQQNKQRGRTVVRLPPLMTSPSGQFKRVAEHFAVVGVTTPPSLLNDSSSSPHTLRESWLNAVVDVAVVFPSKGEYVPLGYEMLKNTPNEAKADLNTDCLGVGQGPMFLCIRRR